MQFISTAMFMPRPEVGHDPLLRELVARLFALEAFIATRRSDAAAITPAVAEHARATVLWLRDICCARRIDAHAAVADDVIGLPDEALLQHARDVAGRLLRAAERADDDGLALFCRGWLRAREERLAKQPSPSTVHEQRADHG